MNNHDIIYMDMNFVSIFDICYGISEKIKKNKAPKVIIYNLSTEYTVTWLKDFFNKDANSKFFILPYGFRELYDLLEKNNIQFYLILGCERNDIFKYFYINKSPNFNIVFWNTSLIFLPYKQLQKFIKNQNLNIDIENLSIEKKFDKLYINYNNKSRYHRCMLMDYLAQNDLLKHGLNSWNQLSEVNSALSNDFYDFKYWKEEKISIDGFEYYVNDEYRPTLLNMNCFVSVVTETSEEILFVTEKTYRQILIEQPFICLGAQNQNTILKNYGFELYDEIFDYEFDSKSNIKDRVQGIIDNLNKIKDSDYYELYDKIKEKVKRNKLNAIKIYNEGLYFSDNLKKIIYDNRGILEYQNINRFSQELINSYMSTLNEKRIIENYKIGVIGLGKLGNEVAQLFANNYYVEGYDIVEKEETNYKIVKNLKKLCIDKNIIFISVPTPHNSLYDGSQPTSHLEPKDFDYTIVKEILTELNNYLTSETLVVLISTVLPGTIRREFKPLIKNYDFVYNPYLIAMGTVKEDVLRPEMVIFGTEDGNVNIHQQKLYKFYNRLFTEELISEKIRYELGTWEEAESIKIFYNTMISAKLSIVNMIQDVSEKLGNMNVDVVTNALEKSTKRIISNMYMKAGMGDGGPCHPRDNIALRYLAKNLDLGYDLFDAIMKSREVQAKNIAKKLLEIRDEYNLPIIILGESYKPGVPYIDGSYSKLIAHYLDYTELIYDQIVKPAIYLLSHRGVYNNTDFPQGSVILDPWREYDKNKGNTVIYYGKS